MNAINTQTDIAKAVNQILLNIGFREKELSPTANFIHDLGFDSLELADFLLQIEMEFDITIPYQVLENEFKTIGDCILVVMKATQEI